MAIRVGQGQFTYELDEGWGRLPEGWSYYEVVGIAVDAKQRVYVFNRGDHPIIVLDQAGAVLGSWGTGAFDRPHGINIGPDDAIYCVDDLGHTVQRFTTEGGLTLTLGTRGVASDTGFTDASPRVTKGGLPFNRPTNVAVGPGGDIFVTDGYRNSRIHKFSHDGRHLLSWGEPGTGPGEFDLPHGIAVDASGTVYMGDRANNRIQLFDSNGTYQGEWTDVTLPCDIFLRDGFAYVAELGLRAGAPDAPDDVPGARISVFSLDGTLRARWGEAHKDGTDSCAPGYFRAAHGIHADAAGNLYVGEVTRTASGGIAPEGCHVFQRFRKVPA